MSDTKIDFLYLSEKDMIEAGVLDAARCVSTMEDVLTLLSEKDCIMGGPNSDMHGLPLRFPEKSDIEGFPLNDSRDRRFMAMPAYLGGRFHMAGMKWYGSNGNNTRKNLPRSILMMTLNDVETGQPIAYMSANLLSAMRTGSVPGVAVKHLSRKDAHVLSLIGAGVVNNACFRAFMAMVPGIDTVKIKGSTPTSATAKKLAEFIKAEYPGVKNVVICADMKEAVSDADIISEGVSVPSGCREFPFIEEKYIKPGAVIISSMRLDMEDEFLAKRATKVVDNYGMYETYCDSMDEYDKSGKLIRSGSPGRYFVHMVRDGIVPREEIRSLGDIVRGTAPGRTSENEIFVVNAGGMGILDIGWGYECYKSALEKGIGVKLNLWDKPYLY